MQIFHFNVIYLDKIIPDLEGSAFSDHADAQREAFRSLCSIVADDVEKGRRIDVRQIDVLAPDGSRLHSVTLAELITAVVPFDDDLFFSEVAEQLTRTGDLDA
ncbi:hypothetical protein SAMN03159496_06183 [Rhizobium sp. NFR07]|nr:hypothetical protein SAMN03159496_06183 [Rhizobium sp. NFR07]